MKLDSKGWVQVQQHVATRCNLTNCLLLLLSNRYPTSCYLLLYIKNGTFLYICSLFFTDLAYQSQLDEVAAMVVVVAAAGAAIAAASDGRTIREPARRKYATGQSEFNVANSDGRYDESWFVREVRCNKRTFLQIVQIVQNNWVAVHGSTPRYNAKYDIQQRVLTTLKYLAQGCTMADAGKLTGMEKSTVIRSVWQVVQVLLHIKQHWIRLPQSGDCEWLSMSQEFEARAGVPNVIGAVDGTLIEITQPQDSEGFCCRKLYTSFNVLAIVDARKRVRYYLIKPGSMNDAGVFNAAGLHEFLPTIVPAGHFLVADGGYRLTNYVITPFSHLTQDSSERKFNYLHSKTRIVVEMAFGDLKNRFKILRKALHHRSLYHDANIIEACFILHNILISLSDNALDSLDDCELPGIPAIPNEITENPRDHAVYFRNSIKDLTLKSSYCEK